MNSVHLYISGKVQGVNFRYFTKQKADSLNIQGWIKNLFDNRVEVMAVGQKDNLYQFIEWCKQGPPSAHVTDVELKSQDVTDKYSDFTIIR